MNHQNFVKYWLRFSNQVETIIIEDVFFCFTFTHIILLFCMTQDELLGKPNILPRSSWDISSEPSQLIRDAAVWSGLVSAEEEECLSHTLADILQSVCDDQDVSKHQQPSHSRHKRAMQHDPLPGQIHGQLSHFD